MTQQERQARSRAKIFEAAMDEFGTQPFEDVTMDAICSRHAISKGMMYHYYTSKEALFLLCVEHTFRALGALSGKAAAPPWNSRMRNRRFSFIFQPGTLFPEA